MQKRSCQLSVAAFTKITEWFVCLHDCCFTEHLRWLITSEAFCKDFVEISYENASCRILEALQWLQLIYLITIAFWFVNIFFDRWGHSKLTTLECYQKVLLCVVLIAQISHYGKFTVLRKLLSIALESSIQINWI